MTNINIRKAATEDIEELHKIESSSFTNPWGKNILEKELANNISLIFIAEFENETVGYILAWSISGFAEIHRIAVITKHRNKGIASAMLGWMEKECKKTGFEKIFLEVNSSNQPAKKLYLKNGYIINGLRKNYYSDGDAILMEKDLTKDIRCGKS